MKLAAAFLHSGIIALVSLGMMVIGWFIIPLAIPRFDFDGKEWRLVKLRWWAHPWGNLRDGILGDRRLHYWNKGDQFPPILDGHDWLKAYWWVAFRNPTNNMKRFYRFFGCNVLECLSLGNTVNVVKSGKHWKLLELQGPIFKYFGFRYSSAKYNIWIGHKIDLKHNDYDFSNDPQRAWKSWTFRFKRL